MPTAQRPCHQSARHMVSGFSLLLAAALTLTSCGRLSSIGQSPQLTSPVESSEFEAMANPELFIQNAPPVPDAQASLWNTSNPLIRDHRATTRGDIVTVLIKIDDRAEMQNTSSRNRTASDKVGIEALAGLPQRLDPKLPDGASLAELADTKSSSVFKGTGTVSRRERLTLKIAATVVATLPNGILQIAGSQEVRVNYELRELTVSGFVRPQDISRHNEVDYDRIAGARIAYGGRGQISDVQQPRYGQQVADILLPW